MFRQFKWRGGQAGKRRRAVVAVQVAVLTTVLVGMAALTIDVGAMYNARADLQRTADAAALAAAAMLAEYEEYGAATPVELARAAAIEYVQRNAVFGRTMTIDPQTDIVFGRATYNVETNSYDFTPTEELPDAVYLRVRHTADSPNGAIPLYFARVFGMNDAETGADAMAVMVPRDIAIVADLSGSHTDDSELRHYGLTDINIYDVWGNLPGGMDLDPRVDQLGFTSEVQVVDNGDGTASISIDMTSDDSEGTPALSHLTIGLPSGAWAMALQTAASDGDHPTSVGADPTTGVGGLKFDDTEFGEDGLVETENFSFTIPVEYLSSMTVATKAAQQSDPSVTYSLTAGPTFGTMNTWGTQGIDAAYNPTTDNGLQYLPYNTQWTDSDVESRLYAQGYTVSEVNALMSSAYDESGAWQYRTAVALGLAFWNSGLPSGLWEQRGVPGGNGNNWVGSSETEWIVGILSRDASQSIDIWQSYINSYMESQLTHMYEANHSFRYRFGVKTFINYLLEQRLSNLQTPELADTPTQPMQAVKGAVDYMVQHIESLETDDQLSLEIYGTTAYHEVDLTHDYQNIGERLMEMQAGHYDSMTNMGGGLERAIEELTSVRSRGTSRKMIILLTDGNANVSESGNVGDYSGGAEYAIDMAAEAAAQGMRIFAVSIGSGANQSLMQQIADIGSGEHFHAEGSIEQYSVELEEIFRQLSGKRPVELIR